MTDDGQLFATTTADSSAFYLPERGRRQLLCVDDYGRSASVSFSVQ